MRKRLVLWFFVLVFVSTSLGGHLPLSVAKTQDNSSLSQPETKYGFFTENKGQWDPAILFAGDTTFGKVAFTKEGIFYQLAKQDKSSAPQTVKLSFVESLTPTIQGAEILPHYHNYFIGNVQSKWASHCRNFTRVTYEDVWAGIDLAYFFTPEGMKYEYYVEPQANISDLQVKVDGATLTNQGKTLQLSTNLGTIQDTKLEVFDQKTKRSIKSTFIATQDTFSFQGIPDVRKNTIVIDPLVYSTYLGGNDNDISMANAVDAVGNNYITGFTISTNLPPPPPLVPGLYPAPGAGSMDAFVSKFSPNGSLLWSTYLGGWSTESGNSIALDPLGTAVYITGTTDSGTPLPFPTTPGAYQSSISPATTDSFITKINSAGDTLMYSTFLGGTDYDIAQDIAVDASGCAYITGYTGTSFPTTLGAYQSSNNGSQDCFVAKLNPAGNGLLDLIYSTYIGGSSMDIAYGITVGKLTGIATITGKTASSTYPTTGGAFKTFYADATTDAFVTQINATGSALLYSSFLGGVGNEIGNGITQDFSGNIYVCGETDSAGVYPTGFPTTGGAFQTSYNTLTDAFVTKLNPDTTVFPAANQLIYSTYLGGSNYDYAYAIAVDLAGYAYVTGETQSSVQTGTNFPTTPDADESGSGGPDGTFYNGSTDAFVTKLSPAGSSLSYSTYLGGNLTDIGNCIALDLLGNVYITGETQSTNFPTKAANQSTIGIVKDAFVTKISTMTIVLSGVLSPGQVNLGWVLFNPGAIAISGYNVYRAISGTGVFIPIFFVSGVTYTSWLDDTGVIGTTYDYYVQAIDNLGAGLANSNMITRGPISAGVTVTLTGSLAFDKVNLAWVVNNPAAVVIPSFQIFRAVSSSLPFTFLASVSGSVRSYQDTTGTVGQKYDYMVVAMDNSSPVSLPLVSSNTVTVGPIQAKPLPILNFSIILNKTEFEKGEPVLLQVYVHNLSVSQATNVVVTMNLPKAIDFTSVSGFPATVSGSSVTFPIGNISALSFKILNLICHVKGNVSSDTTTSIGFSATCLENVSATDSANFILKTKKTATSSVGVSITVPDTQQDPVTGKRFISLGSPLVIQYEIEGGAFPYTLTVDWGDGTVETFVIRNMDDLKGVLKHLYSSRGTFHIRIKIEDASGQSKQSDFDMEIR